LNQQEKDVLLKCLPHDSEQWVELRDEWVEDAADELMASGILQEEDASGANNLNAALFVARRQ